MGHATRVKPKFISFALRKFGAVNIWLTFCSLCVACTSDVPEVTPSEWFARTETRMWKISEVSLRACIARAGFEYFIRLKNPAVLAAFDYTNYREQLDDIGSGIAQVAIDSVTGVTSRRIEKTLESDPNLKYSKGLSKLDLSLYETSMSVCAKTVSKSMLSAQNSLIEAAKATSGEQNFRSITTKTRDAMAKLYAGKRF
jgi:hypothetical protein